jgi:uncharacterized RDD family membrane protein YckC
VLEDRTTIATPEGVDLELTLAGVGSRVGAGFIDALIQLAGLIVLLIGMLLLSSAQGSSDAFAAVMGAGSLLLMVVLFGYPLLFDTLNNGRTLGKLAFGLRVVMADGGPVTFTAAAIRNVLRVVDLLPMFYGVGLVTVIATRLHQRLGDMAARTIVVREPSKRGSTAPISLPAPSLPDGPQWDVSAVTAAELALIRRLLERRSMLFPHRKEELFGRIAARLRPRVGTAGQTLADEQFLEKVAAWKAAVGR